MGLDWVGIGLDLCVGLLYEHRFAVLISQYKPANQCLASSCSGIPSAKEAMARQGSNTWAVVP